MQLARWLDCCALVGGAGVVFLALVLGGEDTVVLTGANSDLRIMGGAAVLVGALSLLIGTLEGEWMPCSHRK